MNYVPLFGRWATLFLVAIVAAGATALSFGLDGKLTGGQATSPAMVDLAAAMKNSWASDNVEPEESSEPGQISESAASGKIIVVNPDGSVRRNSADLPQDVEANDYSARRTVAEQRDQGRATSDTVAQQRSAGRIE